MSWDDSDNYDEPEYDNYDHGDDDSPSWDPPYGKEYVYEGGETPEVGDTVELWQYEDYSVLEGTTGKVLIAPVPGDCRVEWDADSIPSGGDPGDLPYYVMPSRLRKITQDGTLTNALLNIFNRPS